MLCIVERLREINSRMLRYSAFNSFHSGIKCDGFGRIPVNYRTLARTHFTCESFYLHSSRMKGILLYCMSSSLP